MSRARRHRSGRNQPAGKPPVAIKTTTTVTDGPAPAYPAPQRLTVAGRRAGLAEGWTR